MPLKVEGGYSLKLMPRFFFFFAHKLIKKALHQNIRNSQHYVQFIRDPICIINGCE